MVLLLSSLCLSVCLSLSLSLKAREHTLTHFSELDTKHECVLPASVLLEKQFAVPKGRFRDSLSRSVRNNKDPDVPVAEFIAKTHPLLSETQVKKLAKEYAKLTMQLEHDATVDKLNKLYKDA
jgi:hypothetical protein